MNEAEVRRYLGYCGFPGSVAQNCKHNSSRGVRSPRTFAAAICLGALLVMTSVCGGAYYVTDRVDKVAPRMLSDSAADMPESAAVRSLLTPTDYETLTPVERELKVFTYLVRILLYDIGSGLLAT